jgi:tRNA threonylcarbamoyladenosine biosynthesis protein TsaE
VWNRTVVQQPGDIQLIQVTQTPGETQDLAAKLAGHLGPGDLVCLVGELGAGKTTFIQGLARGMGVTANVVSPSFTLVHEHRGRLPLYHLDLYRLAAADLADIGIEEILASDAVVAVEWAERLPRELRPDGLIVEIAFTEDGENARRVRIGAPGPRGAEILSRLGA